jgi:hypothetical protein
MQRLRTQACTLAGRTGDDVHEAFEIFPDAVGIGFMVAALQVGDHPFKGLFVKVAVVSLIVEKSGCR